MKNSGWIGVALVLPGWIAAISDARAGNDSPSPGSSSAILSSANSAKPSRNKPSTNKSAQNLSGKSSSKSSDKSSSDKPSSDDSSSDKKTPYCRSFDAPYLEYKCLDPYLGADVLERFVNYYRLEWGHSKPPSDPDAPDSRRKNWQEAPTTTPPHPFTEWPYGGTTLLGVTRPNSVDSPLMAALANTGFGQMLKAEHVQIYGWINGGGNMSSNSIRPGGNFPISDAYTPNVDQLDEAVVIVERLPDTVQTDHVDWGFQVSALYGENYRYTTALGFASNQLHGHDLFYGYDSPMLFGEVFMPQFAEGLMVRYGRFLSIPDIEQPLTPYNYMYLRSLASTFDSVTTTGVIGSLAVNKNWILQFGVTCGSDTMCWNVGARVHNPFPNPIFSDATMPKDPGAQLSYTAGARWVSDSGRDSVYVVENGINNGTWGYDNLQWTGLTWFHRFSPDWHLSWEMYYAQQRNVLNITDPLHIIENGGYPFTPANGFLFNAPFFARCDDPKVPACTARVFATVAFLNHQFSPLDNLTLRTELFDDMQGQRTGAKTTYIGAGIGWQHWFSPQIEIRPEMDYYRSFGPPAFNGNANALPVPIPPNKRDTVIVAADVIWHY